jgi:hypothetical protein
MVDKHWWKKCRSRGKTTGNFPILVDRPRCHARRRYLPGTPRSRPQHRFWHRGDQSRRRRGVYLHSGGRESGRRFLPPPKNSRHCEGHSAVAIHTPVSAGTPFFPGTRASDPRGLPYAEPPSSIGAGLPPPTAAHGRTHGTNLWAGCPRSQNICPPCRYLWGRRGG